MTPSFRPRTAPQTGPPAPQRHRDNPDLLLRRYLRLAARKASPERDAEADLALADYLISAALLLLLTGAPENGDEEARHEEP